MGDDLDDLDDSAGGRASGRFFRPRGRRAPRAARRASRPDRLPLARGPAGSITLTLISLPFFNFQR